MIVRHQVVGGYFDLTALHQPEPAQRSIHEMGYTSPPQD
jgi:hypothetical protein